MELNLPVVLSGLVDEVRSTSTSWPAQSTFVTGSQRHPIAVVQVSSSQAGEDKLPVIMIHGGFHTGQAYLCTPDHRKGWAQLFAERGHRVVVPDWPAHGKSPGLETIQRLHTQDVAQALGELVSDAGQCILVAHSAGGPLAWWLAEKFPQHIVAIVGVAPGPPANMLPALPNDPVAVNALRFDSQAGCPVYSEPGKAVIVDAKFIKDFWANSPRFPLSHFDAYAQTVVPESPFILNERFNIGGSGLRLDAPHVVGNRPILIVTGERDLRHPKHVDGALADYLGAKFLWLPDAGVCGNGHMLMIEDNSHAIADILLQWLAEEGL
jgi:pimeloyl-ACP methyl ester carboxylesterase